LTAIEAGRDDKEDHTIYIGRLRYENELLPAAVAPKKKAAFANFNGQLVEATDYELLIGTGLRWVRSGQGRALPEGALEVGKTEDGVPHYVGRILFDGTVLLGKVYPQMESILVIWQGQEYQYHEFDVLVEQRVRSGSPSVYWCGPSFF
jgi:Protein of unknown function (DUF3421)